MRKTTLPALAVLISIVVTSVAHASQSHFASWNAAFFQGKFTDHCGWYTEFQTRLSDAPGSAPLLTRGNRFMFRPAVRWLPLGNNTLQVHLGYAWTPNLSPNRN